MHGIYNINMFYPVYYIFLCKDHTKGLCKYIGTNKVAFFYSEQNFSLFSL